MEPAGRGYRVRIDLRVPSSIRRKYRTAVPGARPRRPTLIPSSGPGLPARRRTRLLAIVAVRDEARFLAGFLANVAPHVDGIVALDDGSTDGSRDLLEAHPDVVEVLQVPAGRPAWDEVGNHRRLVAAALCHEPEWLLALDADERLERDFRPRAERVIRRGAPLGFDTVSLKLRDLWGSRDRYRVDGVWGRKRPERLFRARPDHAFDDQPLHACKAPLQARRLRGKAPVADLLLYHLRMVEPADRLARRRRYERADPGARWQPDYGYAYLTDEAGLKLRRLPRGREFEE